MLTNKKHILFADTYIANNMNATQAYKDVYGHNLDDNTAGVNGHKLLKNAKIDAYINAKLAEKQQKLEVTQEFLIKELLDIQKNTKTDLPHTSIKALETIAKMLGLDQKKDEEKSGDINLKLPGLDD